MPTPLGVEDFPNSADVVDPAADGVACQEALRLLRGFRASLCTAFTARGDALFELTDALLCAEGSVSTLVGLCLAPEHRRGHGALYDALNAVAIDTDALRTALARLPLPRLGGRVVLAVDASPWLRPDAATVPERAFCHVYGRGRGSDQRIPGWPYQFVVALEGGPTSWTAPLDVVRLGPEQDTTAVTAAQLRAVVARLVAAGAWRAGDPQVVVVMDSGYDVTRLAHQLADLPVLLVGRVRADRVFLTAVPERAPGAVGRPRRHGAPVWLGEATSWPTPSTTTMTTSARYGQVAVTSFDQLHPRLARRGPWAEHEGDLPIAAGTVVRLSVQRLPGARAADPDTLDAVKPVWLWTSSATSDAETVTTAWSAYLRRFDEEHTFRFLKQVLGWTCPQNRDPAAGDRWTWLVVAAYTQLRLARPLAGDLRRPWERPLPPAALTPSRVRRGFRYLRVKTGCPARAPKPTRPGPGRPPGVKNRRRAPVQPVGKQPAAPTNEVTEG